MRRPGIVILTVLAALVASIGSAAAQDGRDIERRAREACREEARADGYSVQNLGEVRRDGRRVRIDMRLRQGGRNVEARCLYDDRDERVELRVAGGGGTGPLLAATRRACLDEADRRQLRVLDAGRPVADGNDRARMELRVRSEGRNRDARCTYDARREEATLRLEGGSGGAGGGGGGGGGGGDNAANAREWCLREVNNRGWTPIRSGRPADEGRNVWRVPLEVGQDGSLRWYACYFDSRSRAVTLRPSRPGG